jgi:hypothetical protein
VAPVRLRAFVPPEHGAWAMLLVPFLLGTFAAEPSWLSGILLVAWLSAYGATYFALRWHRTRHLRHRGRRFRAPALTYGALLAVSGAIVAWQQPWVLVAVWLFVPFKSVAAWYALRGDERSWVAGVASATAASLMAPLAYGVADGGQVSVAALLFAVCWLAFCGTVLHVKSTIRERDDPRYRTASVAFHAVAALVAGALDPWLLVPFGFLLARAAAVPQQGWRPARIGAVEIVGSVLVLVVTLLVV